MPESIDYRRIGLGIISGIFILIGIVALIAGWEAVVFWILLRSGLLMGAVWLAMPELTSQDSKLTTPVLLLSIVLIMIIATRPRLFLILGTLAIASFFLQGVVRRLTAGLRK